MEGELAQGGEDVGAVVVAHEVAVLAPELVALPVAAVLDVPVAADAGGEAPGAQLVVGEAGHEVTDGGSGARPGEVEGPGPQDGLGEGEVDGGGLDGEHGDVAALDAAVVLLDGASPKRGVGAPGREAWKAPAMYRSMEGWLPLTART